MTAHFTLFRSSSIFKRAQVTLSDYTLVVAVVPGSAVGLVMVASRSI